MCVDKGKKTRSRDTNPTSIGKFRGLVPTLTKSNFPPTVKTVTDGPKVKLLGALSKALWLILVVLRYYFLIFEF